MLKNELINIIEETLTKSFNDKFNTIWHYLFPEEKLEVNSSVLNTQDSKTEMIGIVVEELQYLGHEKLSKTFELSTGIVINEEEIYEESDMFENNGFFEEEEFEM